MLKWTGTVLLNVRVIKRPCNWSNIWILCLSFCNIIVFFLSLSGSELFDRPIFNPAAEGVFPHSGWGESKRSGYYQLESWNTEWYFIIILMERTQRLRRERRGREERGRETQRGKLPSDRREEVLNLLSVSLLL